MKGEYRQNEEDKKTSEHFKCKQKQKLNEQLQNGEISKETFEELMTMLEEQYEFLSTYDEDL